MRDSELRGADGTLLIVTPFLVAILFGGIMYLTMEACRSRSTPAPAKRLRAEVLRAALCGGVSIVGGILVTHEAPPATFVAVLILCLGLGATCYLAMFGSVSPVIPATALMVVVGSAAVSSDFGPLLSGIAVGLPFAITTFFTRGSDANSYRDTLVAALGGAVFGIQAGAIVVGCVCFATLLVRATRKGGMAGMRPGFAPVLSGGLLAALVGQLAIS